MVEQIALATDLALVVVTATVIGFLAKRSGQPTIIAYILTGLLLGPVVLDAVTEEGLVELMAELGLAFLLFLLGIKMRIEDVREILRPIVRISVPQMVLVCLVGTGTALLLGFAFWQALLIGLAVMYSSTAVVIKMLTDKDEITALPGKIDVGVLLVQDIVVVVLLALLAAGRPDGATEVATTLSTILVLTVVIGLVAVAASRYLLPEVFRRIADNEDVFFLVAIGWAFLFVFVTEELGLSIEIGAFLAGLAIAQLPYSTELQDRIAPLMDLFILVFFVSIGLQLEAADLFAYWREAVVASLVLMPAKLCVFFYLLDRQEFSLETTFLGSANMIQVSEFALVVGAVAVAGGFIGEPVLGFLSLVALITMAVSVYVIDYNHAIYARARPWLSRFESEEKADVELPEYRDHAVAIGYDAITRSALPLLEREFGHVVVIDRKTAHVEALEEAGYDAIYGDFRHGEIRKAAGLKRAAFVLSSTAELEVNKALLAELPEDATVFVEADWIEDARELYDLGAHYVITSTHLAAERVGEYLELYVEDRESFRAYVGGDVDRIRRHDERGADASRIERLRGDSGPDSDPGGVVDE